MLMSLKAFTETLSSMGTAKVAATTMPLRGTLIKGLGKRPEP